MVKVYGYCRVSTEGQAADGVSLEAQAAKIQAWAALNDAEVVGVWTDAGLSGGRADNRPQLQACLEAVTAAGGTLVIYSLSRLSRSTADTLAITARLEKSGAEFVSLSEKIETGSAAGRMVFRMLSVLNEFERDQIAERTRAAMQFKKSKGERVGEVPFGFTLHADGVQLVPCPIEQRAIELIVSLRSKGLSLRAIAAEIEAAGAATKKGNSKWSAQMISNILSRKTA
jgi:DNA invertase Pin-like site-specific DNA recombinase